MSAAGRGTGGDHRPDRALTRARSRANVQWENTRSLSEHSRCPSQVPGAGARGRRPAQVPGGGPLAVRVALSGCGAGCVLGPAPPCPPPERAEQCGDQFSVLVSAGTAPPAWLPASGAMDASGAALVLTPVGAPAGARALATAYGRANFPLISLYAAPVPGQALPALPVLPWCFAVGAATGAVPCYAPPFNVA